MKKVFLIGLVGLLCYSCSSKAKDETKVNNNSVNEVLQELPAPPFEKWKFKNLSYELSDDYYQGKKVIKVFRNDLTKPYGTVAFPNVKLDYAGGKYRISIIVKKANHSNEFAFRIQELYPVRTDVVFDLDSISVKDMYKVEDITDFEEAEIEDVGEGFYRCSFTSEIFASYLNLQIGPCITSNHIKSWEAIHKKKAEIFVVPETLKIEEVK
ncbi:hypothetical protein KH5_08900 [Urechidicola sp. KH5]